MKRLSVLFSVFLSGCVIVSVPVDETLNFLASGTSELMSLSSRNSRPCKLSQPVKQVCIEHNPQVAQPDFVPALQLRLKELGVASPVYEAGAMPIGCETVLRYNASRAWASHFTGEAQSYLNQAELQWLRGNALLATAQYQSGRAAYGKWTSTESKLSSVVDDLMCKKVNAR